MLVFIHREKSKVILKRLQIYIFIFTKLKLLVLGSWVCGLHYYYFFFFSYRFATYFLCFQGELEKACADLQTNLAKELERKTSKAEIIRQSKENLAQLQVSI